MRIFRNPDWTVDLEALEDLLFVLFRKREVVVPTRTPFPAEFDFAGLFTTERDDVIANLRTDLLDIFLSHERAIDKASRLRLTRRVRIGRLSDDQLR